MSDSNASQVSAFFRVNSTPNEAKSIKEGRPVFDDMEVCEIRLAGNKQTIGVFPAHDFAEWVEDELGRRQITYAQKYNQQYLKFKEGVTQAASGTPVEELPFLSQGKRLELKALHIYTAEALAGLDGHALDRLGMGGRELVVKAQAYLEAAKSTTDLAGYKSQIERLEAQVAALMAGKPLPEETAKPAADEDDPDNPFNSFEPDDIIAWIKDANPEFQIDGRWGKARLATEAKAINDELAKKKAAA